MVQEKQKKEDPKKTKKNSQPTIKNDKASNKVASPKTSEPVPVEEVFPSFFCRQERVKLRKNEQK